MDKVNTDTLLTIINFLVAFIAVILTMLGFFIKSLINKLESGNEKLTNIDKNMAVLKSEFETSKQLIEIVQRDNERLNGDLSKERTARTTLIGEIHQLELRVQRLESETVN